MTSMLSSTRLPCGNRVLDLAHTHVMGILNVTPDSFSDGGRFSQLDAALRHAEGMVLAGATLIDVGASPLVLVRGRYRRLKSLSG